MSKQKATKFCRTYLGLRAVSLSLKLLAQRELEVVYPFTSALILTVIPLGLDMSSVLEGHHRVQRCAAGVPCLRLLQFIICHPSAKSKKRRSKSLSWANLTYDRSVVRNESLVRWLLEHGADPSRGQPRWNEYDPEDDRNAGAALNSAANVCEVAVF